MSGSHRPLPDQPRSDAEIRQARRDAGEDPDEALERPAEVVENYRQ